MYELELNFDFAADAYVGKDDSGARAEIEGDVLDFAADAYVGKDDSGSRAEIEGDNLEEVEQVDQDVESK